MLRWTLRCNSFNSGFLGVYNKDFLKNGPHQKQVLKKKKRSYQDGARNTWGLRMFVLDTGNLGLNQLCRCINYKCISLCFNFSYEMVTTALLHSTNVNEHLVYTRHSSRCWEVGRGQQRAKRSWSLLLGSLHPREEWWEHRTTEDDFCNKCYKENQTGWCDRDWWEKEHSETLEQTAHWWMKDGNKTSHVKMRRSSFRQNLLQRALFHKDSVR